MIRARYAIAPGGFRLEVDGHADTDACAAVTALQQTVLIFLEQLAGLRPDQIELTVTPMEALP